MPRGRNRCWQTSLEDLTRVPERAHARSKFPNYRGRFSAASSWRLPLLNATRRASGQAQSGASAGRLQDLSGWIGFQRTQATPCAICAAACQRSLVWAYPIDLEFDFWRHPRAPFSSPVAHRRGEPIKKQRSNKFSTGNVCPRHKGHIKRKSAALSALDPVTSPRLSTYLAVSTGSPKQMKQPGYDGLLCGIRPVPTYCLNPSAKLTWVADGEEGGSACAGVASSAVPRREREQRAACRPRVPGGPRRSAKTPT